MKTNYTQKQIAEAITYWTQKLVNESLKDETKAKLDKAAVKFAKSFGDCIKNKQVGRIEDETKDALMAIKKTIRVNSNVKSNPMSSMFIQMIFDGDKKAVDNLMKTTEQFNYFANVVFGVWHRDPELSKWLKKNLPQNAKKFDTVEEYIASLAGDNAESSSAEDDEEGNDNLDGNGDDIQEDDGKEKGSENLENQADGTESSETQEDIEEGVIGAGAGALAGDRIGQMVGKHFKNPDTVKTICTTAGAIGGAMLEGDGRIPDEEFMAPVTEEDVPENTVGALVKVLQKNCKDEDKLLFRVNKKECFIFDICSKNGTAVIDMVPGSLNGRESLDETDSRDIEQKNLKPLKKGK